ncbi:HIT family protein [Agromyces mediolanus]
MSGMHTDCPFCEIVMNEDPDAREIYRDTGTVAFFPTEPAVLGHTMVIPRRHVPDVWELDAHTASRVASTTLVIASAIRVALKPDGLNIIQSNGHAASQTVMHLHVHIVPRWENDRIGRIWPPESDYSEAQKDDAWEALREAVRGFRTR